MGALPDFRTKQKAIEARFRPQFEAAQKDFLAAHAAATEAGSWPRDALVAYCARIEDLNAQMLDAAMAAMRAMMDPYTKHPAIRQRAKGLLARAEAELRQELAKPLCGWTSAKIAAAFAEAKKTDAATEDLFAEMVSAALEED